MVATLTHRPGVPVPVPPVAPATYSVTADCTACGACLLTCPAAAFVVGLPLTVDPLRCTDCGACVEVCPADAVVRVCPTPAPPTPSPPAPTIFAPSPPTPTIFAPSPPAPTIFASCLPAPACRPARDEDQRAEGEDRRAQPGPFQIEGGRP